MMGKEILSKENGWRKLIKGKENVEKHMVVVGQGKVVNVEKRKLDYTNSCFIEVEEGEGFISH